MKMFPSTLVAATVLASAVGLAATTAIAADNYPSKRVTIIVPYSAGGGTDTVARHIAQGLSEKWGHPVTVENRPGSGGTLGSAQAAIARNDGYTLYMGGTGTVSIAPALYSALQYDPLTDFEPVALAMEFPNVLVVPKSSGIDSLQGFIEVAKKGGATFGSSGVGSSLHLSGEMFNLHAGLDMTHVPYRGSSEAVPAVISANVDMMFDNLPSAIAQVQAGTLTPLAVTSAKRSESLPDVPTIAESGIEGLEDFVVVAWFGLMAPAGTDEAIIAKLNADMNEVLQGERFQEYAASTGSVVTGGSSEDFAKFLEAEIAKWDGVASAAGVKIN